MGRDKAGQVTNGLHINALAGLATRTPGPFKSQLHYMLPWGLWVSCLTLPSLGSLSVKQE